MILPPLNTIKLAVECLQSLSVTPMGEVSVDASPMVAMSVTGGGRVARVNDDG